MSDRVAVVVIDVSRGSFIKRKDDGSIDFVSPIPSPFNYGHVPGTVGDDGDALDAVVLGPRLTRGTSATVTIRGRVGFIDAGLSDPKWICSAAPLGSAERRQIERFFRRYALVKRLLNKARGMPGPTRYVGWL